MEPPMLRGFLPGNACACLSLLAPASAVEAERRCACNNSAGHARLSRLRRVTGVSAMLLVLGLLAWPQVIEFESKGLSYQALTKNGITVMFATLPAHIKDFNIIQITITNGS